MGRFIVSIVDYVYNFEVKSEVAWCNARVELLDTLGCAMESLEISDECVRMLGPVWPGAGAVPNGFKLPGTRFQLDPVKGVLTWELFLVANGVILLVNTRPQQLDKFLQTRNIQEIIWGP